MSENLTFGEIMDTKNKNAENFYNDVRMFIQVQSIGNLDHAKLDEAMDAAIPTCFWDMAFEQISKVGDLSELKPSHIKSEFVFKDISVRLQDGETMTQGTLRSALQNSYDDPIEYRAIANDEHMFNVVCKDVTLSLFKHEWFSELATHTFLQYLENMKGISYSKGKQS